MAQRVIPGGRPLFGQDVERAKRLESGTMPLRRQCEPEEAARPAFSVGHGSLSVRGDWLGADATLCEIIGLEARELCATTLVAITHSDDVDEDLLQLERIGRGDAEAYHHHKRIVHKDGRVVWVSQIVWAITDDRGTRLHLSCQMSPAVAPQPPDAERRRVVATLNSIGEAVIAADASGRITHMNPAAETMTGFSITDALGQALDDVVKIMDEALGSQVNELTELCSVPGSVERGEAGERGTKASVARRDLTLVSRDATSKRPVSATCSAIRDGEGAPGGVVLVVRDRSEEHRAAASFRALIEASPELIVVHNGGTIVYVNQAVLKALGYETREELLGRSFIELIHPEDRESAEIPVVEASGERVDRTSDPPMVMRWFEKRGGLRSTETLSIPTEFDGQDAVVVVARDVTERNEIQQRLLRNDRMAALGTLAAGVAHEINNPLTYLLVNLEHVQRRLRALAASDSPIEELEADNAPDVLNKYVESLSHAVEGANRVRQIVRDLMTFSQGNIEHRGLVDVRGVVESSIQMAWHEIRHRAKLVKHLSEVPPVEANEARLGQVFLNLLVNAAQAIPEGEANKHEVRVSTREDDQGNVVVEVADTGAGIPRETLPRIFDPFFTTKTPGSPGSGMGLGLSISHGTIRSMGGELRVESAPGRGSVFRVVMPASKSYRGHGTNSSPIIRPLARKRILVIDDEPLVSNAIARVLADDNDVDVCQNAREALDRINADAKFDLILCDLMMPVMTGMDLYAEVVRVAPQVVGRMVFMTGGAFTPRARAFLESVSNPCLEKPLEMNKLRSLIGRAGEMVRSG
jgi:PAS domain S-box-containing protein